jgi:MFS family permease
VYQVADTSVVARGGRALARGRTHVSRTVILLGLTSLFTDVSSEMVNAVLPLYLVYTLGLSPLAFGAIDGLQQGASSLVRVLGGFAADRLGRYKEVAALGYGLSAACRFGLLVAGRSWGVIAGVVFTDRVGKGIRTAPRDAMISLSSDPEHLGTAFGVHRALDTAGATIGPLVAFALLVLIPQGFDSVFFVSFCFALIGLSILVLFVENRPQQQVAVEPEERLTLRAAAELVRIPGFAPLVAVGSLLALATISDAFLYLSLQRHLGLAVRNLPLLFVATSAVYMILAVPVGRLADRVGRKLVFVVGYSLLLVTYAALVLPPFGLAAVVLVVLAFGAYYAATDGVLMAIGSALLPESARATGLSLIVTATSIAKLLASVLFGAVWTVAGLRTALIAFGCALVLAAAVGAAVLARTRDA